MADQQHSGWAEGEHEEPVGPFVRDMKPPRGVLVSDMPALKPQYSKPRVKGVPGATAHTDEDYRPGGGQWKDAAK